MNINRFVPVERRPHPVLRRRPATAHSSRDLIVLMSFLWSLGMAMSVSQDYLGPDSRLRYLMFTVPVVAAAVSRPLALALGLTEKALWLLPFLFLAGAYHSLNGDFNAAFQAGLLVLGLAWFCSPVVHFRREDIYRAYLASIVVGFFIWIFTDFNRWGLFPGTTDPAYGVWRISYFSNIAFTAFFSLFVVLIATKNGWKSNNKYILSIALYFLIFSYVRTAIIGFALYIFCQFIFSKINRPVYLFILSLVVAIVANAFIAYSSSLFNFLQDIPIISRLFLRGESQLSEFEIYQQLYRPWLWGEQIKLFLSSSYFMGWGSIPFDDLVQNRLFDFRFDASDTVSLPTKLLSQFGLAAIFFWVFLIVCLKQTANRMDRWGCAVFPVVFTAMMHWGSMFHITDPMAILYFGLLVKGSALVTGQSAHKQLGVRSTAGRPRPPVAQAGMR